MIKWFEDSDTNCPQTKYGFRWFVSADNRYHISYEFRTNTWTLEYFPTGRIWTRDDRETCKALAENYERHLEREFEKENGND